MWTLIVLAGVALLGVVAWRRGIFKRLLGPSVSGPQLGGYPQGFAGGVGPNEQGANVGGQSAYGKVCNQVYRAGGQAAMSAPDPRVQVAGAAAQLAGPAICASHEYVADKVWDGSKWVAKNTASAAKSLYDNTLGKLF